MPKIIKLKREPKEPVRSKQTYDLSLFYCHDEESIKLKELFKEVSSNLSELKERLTKDPLYIMEVDESIPMEDYKVFYGDGYLNIEVPLIEKDIHLKDREQEYSKKLQEYKQWLQENKEDVEYTLEQRRLKQEKKHEKEKQDIQKEIERLQGLLGK